MLPIFPPGLVYSCFSQFKAHWLLPIGCRHGYGSTARRMANLRAVSYHHVNDCSVIRCS